MTLVVQWWFFTTGAHEHILTDVQRLFNQAGYATERKNVPHSRGMKKADLHVKDFRLGGIRDVIIDGGVLSQR
jgi:hypothetical protein